MTQADLAGMVKLRVCVGFLGESHQNPWWPSSFFSASSNAFLTPVFGKTSFSAQYYGVKEAAGIVHDEHIGIGEGVFHLFRLPETIEIELHGLLATTGIIDEARQVIESREAAEAFLQDHSKEYDVDAVGPVRLGNTAGLEKRSTWQIAAQHYLKAFREDIRIFPYVSEGR